jgi:hypothetical protein
MRARLIRIEPHPTDWYNLRSWSNFVYLTDDGIEEVVSELYVPDNCKEIGCEIELVYTFFSHGGCEGYHFEPRKLATKAQEDDTYTLEA